MNNHRLLTGLLAAILSGYGLCNASAEMASRLDVANIRFALAGFYLDIYKYTNLRRVVEKNLAQAQLVLAEMHARYEQGVALQNDITRYELLVSNLNLQLIKIGNTLEILNNNLVVTAGLPEGTIVEPDATILARSLPAMGENYWVEEAENNSPSVQLAGNGVAISRKTEDLARSEMYPKVGLQAAWTMDGPILVEIPPINRNLSYWYVGIGVSYNLSSLYKNNKTISRAKVATREASERLEAVRENVSLEIRSDHVRHLEAYEELKTQEKSVELAIRNYNTIATRYMAGMALITDMLDAANAKLDAERQLVDARINVIYSYYKLLLLFVPLFCRGMASVIISIVYLTSIVQSGLPFQVFPQALTINGFTGAVMGAVLGPAVIGELFQSTLARNAAQLGTVATDFNPVTAHIPLGELAGMVNLQAMAVSMKEIYGWLLMASLVVLVLVFVSYSPIRPQALFPKWRTIRRTIRRVVRQASREEKVKGLVCQSILCL